MIKLDFSIFIYIIFGILPSLVWLSYYLRKDLHPEPKKEILKIFLWGAAITLPVFFVQIGSVFLLKSFNISPIIFSFIYWFLIIALSEEFFKYLVIKIKILQSKYLDEPVDIMIYMVVAALGFAALENVLYLFIPMGQLPFDEMIRRTIFVTFIRFIGATFLHTLCSAIIGYAIAISLHNQKNRTLKATSGIVIAVTLHGIYNFSIMQLTGVLQIIIPAITIITLAFLVFSGFEKLKKMKGLTIIDGVSIKDIHPSLKHVPLSTKSIKN